MPSSTLTAHRAQLQPQKGTLTTAKLVKEEVENDQRGAPAANQKAPADHGLGGGSSSWLAVAASGNRLW